MSNSGEQCAPGQLWVPGMHLDEEYPVPSSQELVELWQTYSQTNALPTRGVYGAYVPPKQEVRAIASVDLCEVVRDTLGSVHIANGIQRTTPYTRYTYSDETWFDRSLSSEELERSVVATTLQTAMSEGFVQPVEFIGGIGALLRSWRAQGIYCVANTATLPGCERGTIQYTLGRDLPGALDGILFPRNWNNSSAMTKAAALITLAAEAELDLEELPVAHIDDAVHHANSFLTAFPDKSNLKIVVPAYGWNRELDETLRAASPFEAFVAADSFFREELSQS